MTKAQGQPLKHIPFSFELISCFYSKYFTMKMLKLMNKESEQLSKSQSKFTSVKGRKQECTQHHVF